MNFTADEAGIVAQMFSGQSTTALQTLFSTNMYVVAQLQMFGDPNSDPVRQAWAFFDQTRATTFANKLKSGAPRSAVFVFQGSTVVQQSGEVGLLGIWQGRSTWGQPLPNAHTNELADVATVTSSAKASAVVPISDDGWHAKSPPKRKTKDNS